MHKKTIIFLRIRIFLICYRQLEVTITSPTLILLRYIFFLQILLILHKILIVFLLHLFYYTILILYSNSYLIVKNTIWWNSNLNFRGYQSLNFSDLMDFICFGQLFLLIMRRLLYFLIINRLVDLFLNNLTKEEHQIRCLLF